MKATTPLPPTHKCSHCARGERDTDADMLVCGSCNGRPVRAWVCMEHFDMLGDDGADVRIVEAVSNSAKEVLARSLWEKYVSARDLAKRLGSPSPGNMWSYRNAVEIHSRWMKLTAELPGYVY